jgi:hypothetical protein
MWALLHSEAGVQAMSLLALDDPHREDHRPMPLWSARQDDWLASDPVVLRDEGREPEPPSYLAVWVSGGRDGLGLRWTRLASVSDGAPEVFTKHLTAAVGSGPELPEGARATLVPVPRHGPTVHLILCTPRALWWIEGLESPRVTPIIERPWFVTGSLEMAGALFEPGSDEDEDRSGRLYIVHRDDSADGRERLRYVDIVLGRQVSFNQFREPGGAPVGFVQIRGKKGVLCRSGRTLVLFRPGGQPSELARDDYLGRASRIQVYGGLALAWGAERFEARKMWFALVIDLLGDRVIGRLTWDVPTPPLLPMGRYLFSVEETSDERRADGNLPTAHRELFLTRRRVQDPGSA